MNKRNQQLNLGIDLVEIEEEKSPRPKEMPADEKTKNTDASASVFGWRFQVVTGIILSLRNIKKLKSVEIEGHTEDVELYFTDRDPEYIQVKAIQGDPISEKDNSKAVLAMNTLINTSNLTKGKYSKIVYVANFRNILDLKEPLLEMVWRPRVDEPFVQSYSALPSKARDNIQKRIKSAQKQLAKKYSNSIEFFNTDKLYLATILFSSNDQDEQKFLSLEESIQTMFESLDIKIPRTRVHNIRDMLVTKYLANAGDKATESNHKTITKKSLIWRILFKIIDDIPDNFYDDKPIGIQEDIEVYENEFIQDQTENIDVINKIFSGLHSYADINSISIAKKVVEEFIKCKWSDYKDIFPLYESPEIQEYGIKMIMTRLLSGKRTIEKIQKGVNLS